jgi:hypothetical protein
MNPYLTHAAVSLPQNIPANAAARRLQTGMEYPTAPRICWGLPNATLFQILRRGSVNRFIGS